MGIGSSARPKVLLTDQLTCLDWVEFSIRCTHYFGKRYCSPDANCTCMPLLRFQNHINLRLLLLSSSTSTIYRFFIEHITVLSLVFDFITIICQIRTGDSH